MKDAREEPSRRKVLGMLGGAAAGAGMNISLSDPAIAEERMEKREQMKQPQTPQQALTRKVVEELAQRFKTIGERALNPDEQPAADKLLEEYLSSFRYVSGATKERILAIDQIALNRALYETVRQKLSNKYIAWTIADHAEKIGRLAIEAERRRRYPENFLGSPREIDL